MAQRHHRTVLALAGLVLAAAGPGFAAGSGGPFADADDARLVARGAGVYATHCAACHGARLEGQRGWEQPNDPPLPPPLDASGHAWEHPDAELLRKVAVGDPDSPMPPFGAALPADDITAAVAYVKAAWPKGARGYQALLNPDARGLPAGEWTLPPECVPRHRRLPPG